jgi:hypothetical protein
MKLSVIRYFFYTLLIIPVLSSCGGSTNKDACLRSVKEMFPNATVYAPFEGSNYTFFVADSVNFYMVKTMSLTSPKVTNVVVLTIK